MFVYLAASIANHLLYNIQDVGGFACKDHDTDPNLEAPTPLASPGPGVQKEDTYRVVVLHTRDFCLQTGILLAKRASYRITVEPTDPPEPWNDTGVHVPFGGFSAKEPPIWYQRIFLTLGLPLRRELFKDWGRIALRYGRVGGEEAFLDPDPDDPKIESPFKPTRDGELFMFINDAVIGIPGLYGWLYRNNIGSAQVTVTRTR
jgi:hypothetical protein